MTVVLKIYEAYEVVIFISSRLICPQFSLVFLLAFKDKFLKSLPGKRYLYSSFECRLTREQNTKE